MEHCGEHGSEGRDRDLFQEDGLCVQPDTCTSISYSGSEAVSVSVAGQESRPASVDVSSEHPPEEDNVEIEEAFYDQIRMPVPEARPHLGPSRLEALDGLLFVVRR